MKKSLEKFNELVDAFGKLPGVGKKSATRFAYFVSLQDNFGGLKLAQCIEDAVRFIRRCERCGSLSEDELCDVCTDDSKEPIIALVESPKDVLVIDQNRVFSGRYFVVDEVDEDMICRLSKMIEIYKIKEILFAFTPGLNSDALMLFIEDKLCNFNNIKFSKIAQGVPTGVSLENIDMLSLLKAIESRTDA